MHFETNLTLICANGPLASVASATYNGKMARSALTIPIVLCLFLGAANAQAGSFYYEFDVGAGTVTNSGYFGSGFTGASSMGAAVDVALFYSFQGSAPLSIQAGLMNRMISVSAGTGSYLYDALYPAIRIQMSLLYFGGGATLLGAVDRGDGNLALDTGGTSLYVEGGALWAVTPLFSLGGFGAMQMPSGTAGSATTLEIGAVLRFYFGISSGSGSKSSGEYHGWRYPFGQQKN